MIENIFCGQAVFLEEKAVHAKSAKKKHAAKGILSEKAREEKF